MIKNILFFLFIFITASQAGDWPSFMGPSKNDNAPADRAFTADLLKWSKVWEKSIGVGYSALIVAEDCAYTLSHDQQKTESIFCFDAMSGRLKWTHSYEGPLLNKLHAGGPNASVTVEGDFIYSVGKGGQAFCLNKADGSVVWQQNLQKIMGIDMPAFGFAGSPLIYKNRVLFTSGKALALDKYSGKLIWLSKNISQEDAAYHPGHATPVVFTQDGVDYMTFLIGTGLEILKISDGSHVARHNLNAEYNMTATTPLVLNDGKKIFISWNRYSEMLEFDGKSLSSVYKLKGYVHTMQNSIYKDGVIYGTHGKDRGKRTSLMAIDVASGKTLWEQKGFKWSQLTLIGDTLLCLGVDGLMVTVKAQPEKYEEISSLQAQNNTCWTKVTYAHNRLYLRNNRGRIICYALK